MPAGIGPARALEAGGDVGEYRAKAAFLYNFIRYTSWPADAFESDKAPLELLVVGHDPFDEHLTETFRGKELHGRTVSIRHTRDVPDELRAHLIFTSGLADEAARRLIANCARRPILLVGPEAGFAAKGATANFYIDKKKVRFEMNPAAIRRARLEVSSELLKLAKIVREESK